ncbi:hypothetical protein B4086_5746 [Bacillus cereus]|nr:hypothetical protein B4086_5746 [Bacillus cereus]
MQHSVFFGLVMIAFSLMLCGVVSCRLDARKKKKEKKSR